MSSDLDRIRTLYEQGLFLQAHAAGAALGPLETWPGVEGRVLAGRLAAQLGGQRRALRLHARAYREAPAHPQTRYYRALDVLRHRGPLETWRLLDGFGEMPEAGRTVRADLFALRGVAAGMLRDFDAADAWMSRALAEDPGNAWVESERSRVLEMEDRCDEALASARRATEMRPGYPPAVEALARTLELLDQADAAITVLDAAVGRVESAILHAHLAYLLLERRRTAEARAVLDRYEACAPLMDPPMREWLDAQRFDAAYQDGDVASALVFARRVDSPFHRAAVERLSDPARGGARVLLDVRFVRQHHVTCAPATLAAMSAYWKMPAEHLAVAEAICYDGTPAHSERRWAEERGFRVREFTVTWESAVALLDRGIPFTLTTVDPGNAHLQAVVGYDARLGVLLVRDPTVPSIREALADELLKHYRSSGPRGMAMVPSARARELEDLDLPDAGLHDVFHELQGALARHERARAKERMADLAARGADHRLTLTARRALAAYDANPAEMLASLDALLARYPGDANLELSRLATLRELQRPADRAAALRAICERKDSDPLFWVFRASELADDAREHPAAEALLRRALKRRPVDARALYQLGRVRWTARDADGALLLHRFAACLDDLDEHVVDTYVSIARHAGRADTAIQFLQARFRRFGGRSGRPACTLFAALEALERVEDGLRVLDEALARRPDDGELQLFASEQEARVGREARAATLLESARGRTSRAAWLRSSAGLAERRGDLRGALGQWRQVLDLEPLAMDAHASVARLLAETRDRRAAVEALEDAGRRFPHSYALARLRAEWRPEDPAEEERVIRGLVGMHPSDAWARLELALMLARSRRLEDALAEAEHAHRLHPTDAATFWLRGRLLADLGRRDEAEAVLRDGVRLSADAPSLIDALMGVCASAPARCAALAFIREQLAAQASHGEGLLAWRTRARETLPPGDVLLQLRQFRESRPDLWQSWSALVAQLRETAQADESVAVAKEACARFALMPGAWRDLAAAHAARGDAAEERAALRRAMELNPAWTDAVLDLASAHERAGELEPARVELERAIARTRFEAPLHLALARVLWKLRRPEEAVRRVEEALQVAPEYDEAWGALRAWSEELKRPGLAVDLARALAQRRPENANAWLLLARMFPRDADPAARLDAVERAIRLAPSVPDAHDLKAVCLSEAGRWEDAAAACRAVDPAPVELRGRAAWIEARRGRMNDALTGMRKVVAEEPGYYWGWTQIAQWTRELRDSSGLLEAAQAMARLAPDEPVPFGYLGEARLATRDRTGAKHALRRAMEIDPAYGFAGMSLFDLQLDDGELADAARTLATLRTHVGDEYVLARAVRLACRQGARPAAVKALRELVLSASEDRWPLGAAVEAFADRGWSADLDATLDETVVWPSANPVVGTVWVERVCGRPDWGVAGRRVAEFLASRTRAGQSATARYLEMRAEAGHGWTVRRFVGRHRDALRADTVLWGAAGYALETIGAHARTVEWLADHASRRDAQPWMLLNLVLALEHRGRTADAAEAARRALKLAEDHTTPYLAVWASMEEVLDGSAAPAAARLDALDPATLNEYYRCLFSIAKGVLTLRRATDREAGFQEACSRLREAEVAMPRWRKDTLLRRAYRRAVARIARERGGAWLWRFGRWFHSVFTVE